VAFVRSWLLTSTKQREEKFFSINISHVVTSRPIPPEKPKETERETVDENGDEQPKTIDPSLLNRPSDPSRSRLVFDKKPSVSKTRSTDVLERAREMGKKIWSLEKLQRIVELALDPDPYGLGASAAGGRTGSQSASRAGKDNLAKLLENERVYGPSDRDPTVSSREMVPLRGYYIYIYDVEEKTKPIMVREYSKVSDPKDGDWPQFRLVSEGRCPFIIDEHYDADKESRARAKARAAKAANAKAAEKETTTAAEVQPHAVTGKRTLAEMEDGHQRGTSTATTTTTKAEMFDRSRICNPPVLDFTQNAFISHNKGGRLLAGEPVASGLQPSKLTSAIQSHVVSSTTGGVLGAKAGTSKEIHGLQRKVVLQKAAMPTLSHHDSASRRMMATVDAAAHEGHGALVRSASASQALQRPDKVDEAQVREREKLKRTASVPIQQPKKRDPKPGYCENCQDKFADFDEVRCILCE
jgi:regulatory subunit for Cdc7p protein kinase